MTIIVTTLECVRDTPASDWQRTILDQSIYDVDGAASDSFPQIVSERAKGGEPLRVITFDVVPQKVDVSRA